MSRPDLEFAMRTLAASTGSPAPLPDGELIWRRAAARVRWRQYELATRPLRVAEGTAAVVCAAAGAAALFTLRPAFAALLAMDPALVRLAGFALAVAASVALYLVRALAAEK